MRMYTHLQLKKKKNYLVGGHKPRHFCAGRQLTIDHAFDFALGPSIIDIDYSYHVPLYPTNKRLIKLTQSISKYWYSKTNLPWLKFVFDAVLKAFAFNFHRRQNQTISDKMSGISNAFARFEAKNFTVN